MTSESVLNNAGYAIFGRGGGGSGGHYLFASLDELDSVIAEWMKLRDDIGADRDKFWQAQQLIGPPAEDEPSRRQSDALIDSLTTALDHNESLRNYSDSYIMKLMAAREQYLTTDEESAERLRDVDA